MKTNLPIKATTLNIALKIIFVLIELGAICGETVTYSQLQTTMNNVVTSGAQNITSVAALQSIKTQLNANKSTFDKAAAITISPLDYRTQVSSDIASYASQAGVTIEGYAFSATSNASIIVAGTTPQFVTLTIGNPVSYSSFIKFLKCLETNLPKLQVLGIDISPADSSGTTINVKPLTIEVFTK